MAHPLIHLARETLGAYLAGKPWQPQSGSLPPQACFVSLKTPSGDLRGCMGTLAPAWDSAEEEVARNAVAAAVRDPRFPAVGAHELPGLVLSIDLLSPPEPISGPEALDPRVYGVIVRWKGRSGVLLPDLEGVDTPQQQISICRRKGQIPPDAPVSLERFRVQRIREKEEGEESGGD
ncbi:MAG: AmmeMemoRadiSam system protein A [Deltaproteobacteria bacterium]|nr:AmmeMemoRadiSam system protein A [Deltaproteobacteria bacterium]